jgi:hypothetical protein
LSRLRQVLRDVGLGMLSLAVKLSIHPKQVFVLLEDKSSAAVDGQPSAQPSKSELFYTNYRIILDRHLMASFKTFSAPLCRRAFTSPFLFTVLINVADKVHHHNISTIIITITPPPGH